MFCLAVLFILLGAVLEGLPAVVILLPTFMPVVTRLGIDLVHYSTVVVAATGIGLFLPPIGVGLLMALRFANISVGEHFKAYWPYLLALVFGLMLLIVFPEITLVLPRHAGAVR